MKKRVDKFKWIRVKNELTLKSNSRPSLILWNSTIYFFLNQNKRCWVSQGFFSKNKKRLSWKGLKSQIADHYILINETDFWFIFLTWLSLLPFFSCWVLGYFSFQNKAKGAFKYEGINQRYLKYWADVADKICFGRT